MPIDLPRPPPLVHLPPRSGRNGRWPTGTGSLAELTWFGAGRQIMTSASAAMLFAAAAGASFDYALTEANPGWARWLNLATAAVSLAIGLIWRAAVKNHLAEIRKVLR